MDLSWSSSSPSNIETINDIRKYLVVIASNAQIPNKMVVKTMSAIQLH